MRHLRIHPQPSAATQHSGIPSRVLAGGRDPVVAPIHPQASTARIWAELETVPRAGYCLPHVEPAKAAEPILAALEVSHRTQQHDSGPW